MKRFIVIFLLTILFPVLSNAVNQKEANPDDDFGWVAFGLGAGIAHDFTSVLNTNFGRRHSIQFAYHGSYNFSLSNNPEGFSSISIGYCYSSVSRFTRIAFSAGPSFVYGEKEIEDINERQYFKGIGFLFNCQSILTPFKEFGLGLDLYININSMQKLGGVALTFVIEGNK